MGIETGISKGWPPLLKEESQWQENAIDRVRLEDFPGESGRNRTVFRKQSRGGTTVSA